MQLSRRTLCGALAGLTLAGCGTAKRTRASTRPKRLLVTMDDFDVSRPIGRSVVGDDAAIRAALSDRGIQAIAFPNLSRSPDGQLLDILTAWSRDGHVIGNHTYSHERASQQGAAPFLEDMMRNHDGLQTLDTFQPLLRFPYLDEGGDLDTRDAIRAGLTERGYRNLPVTIDATDWAINTRYKNHLGANTLPNTARYRDFYVRHTREMAAYFDDVATALGHGDMVHVLLVHHNQLNTDMLGDVLDGLTADGWTFTDAPTALNDPVLKQLPDHINRGWSHLTDLQSDARKNGDYAPLPYPDRAQGFAGPAMDAAGL